MVAVALFNQPQFNLQENAVSGSKVLNGTTILFNSLLLPKLKKIIAQSVFNYNSAHLNMAVCNTQVIYAYTDTCELFIAIDLDNTTQLVYSTVQKNVNCAMFDNMTDNIIEYVKNIFVGSNRPVDDTIVFINKDPSPAEVNPRNNILSWNILAKTLSQQPSEYEWMTRLKYILEASMDICNADIINFSEVDENWEADFFALRNNIFRQYAYVYLPKVQSVDMNSITARHGNLLLFKKNRFKLDTSSITRIYEHFADSNQILGVICLRDTYCNKRFVIGSVHLKSASSLSYFNFPSNTFNAQDYQRRVGNHVKIKSRFDHMKCLLDTIDSFESKDTITMLMGDFNEHYTAEILNILSPENTYYSFCKSTSPEKDCITQAPIQNKNVNAEDNKKSIEILDYILFKNFFKFETLDSKLKDIKEYVLKNSVSDHYPILVSL